MIVRSRRWIAGVGVLALAGSACTDAAGYDLDYILSQAPFIATMRESVAYEAQEMPRLPPPNSVPIAAPSYDILPAFTQTQLDSVGAVLTNPLPASQEVLARGATVYQNQCFVCHGADGQGNGPVVGAGKFPTGPTLVGGTALTRSDGYMYGVIRVGRGLMPQYGDRVGHQDRWAVVHYVRQLQQQVSPAEAAASAQAAPVPTAEPAAAATGGQAPGAQPAGQPGAQPAGQPGATPDQTPATPGQ